VTAATRFWRWLRSPVVLSERGERRLMLFGPPACTFVLGLLLGLALR